MASEALFDLRSHISDLRLSALCLCASAPLCLTKLSSFVIVFMQNKANFRKSQVNVRPLVIMNYERKSDWTLGENKPNSKPIKANFRKAQINVNSFITKDYRKNDAFAVQKNKPNSNPIRTQSKPILEQQWLPGTKHPLEQSVEQETGIEVESYHEQEGEKNDDK